MTVADHLDYAACPGAANHGNPFRYCPVEACGWMEEPEPNPTPPEDDPELDVHPAVAAYDELKAAADAALGNCEAELDRLRAENAALRRDGAVVAGYILGWTPEQRAMFPSSEARIAAADICAHRLREADRG